MKKLGLVLGSGGARGLLHLGVIKSLEKNHIKIDFLAGSSIGSLVGAMYAARGFGSIQEIINLILGQKLEVFLAYLDPFGKGGLVRGKRLEKLIRAWIGVQNFGDLKIPMAVIAVDLMTGQVIEMRQGNLPQAVRASMAVPSIFAPVEIEGSLLVDGGILNPVPCKAVRRLGAEVVLAVNLDYRLGNNGFDTQFAGSVGFKRIDRVLMRTLDVVRHDLAQKDTMEADIVLNPELDVPGIIGIGTYFSKNKARDLIKLGEDIMDAKISLIDEKITNHHR